MSGDRQPHILVVTGSEETDDLAYSLECPYPEGHANKLDCPGLEQCDCPDPDEPENHIPDQSREDFIRALSEYEELHPNGGHWHISPDCWGKTALIDWLDNDDGVPKVAGRYPMWVGTDGEYSGPEDAVLVLTPAVEAVSQ